MKLGYSILLRILLKVFATISFLGIVGIVFFLADKFPDQMDQFARNKGGQILGWFMVIQSFFLVALALWILTKVKSSIDKRKRRVQRAKEKQDII